VVIKLGAQGAALGNAKWLALSLPAPPVEAIDTTGAGDAFAAGFLSAELKGGMAEDCLRAGILAGAEAVKKIGGQPG
jgi:sugar/nucleoside kinase (ribokinase family)